MKEEFMSVCDREIYLKRWKGLLRKWFWIEIWKWVILKRFRIWEWERILGRTNSMYNGRKEIGICKKLKRS